MPGPGKRTFGTAAGGSMANVKPESTTAKKTTHQKDSLREGVETIVFVVVLVLLLKLFVVEAFVIPTGSMAETLLGYHKHFDCPECGHSFPINCSDEVDPQEGAPFPVPNCRCPNCLYEHTFTPSSPSPGYNSGDRVLVHKAVYHVEPANRWDVVVFKYPDGPQKRHVPQNYIKRLWAFGGETIAIHRGEVFRTTSLTYRDANGQPTEEVAERPLDEWGARFTYHNSESAKSLFEKGRTAGFPDGQNGFELLRKPDRLILAMRRLVYDNDHQSKTLIEKNAPPRWSADATRPGAAGWTNDNAKSPKLFTHAGNELGWIRYRHLTENLWANPPNALPGPIRNMMGYNSPKLPPNKKQDQFDYWCSDLMVECRARVSQPGTTVILELSQGEFRYQARLAAGKATLFAIGRGGEKQIAEAACAFDGAAQYDLRFANIDRRLRVAVNGRSVDFGAAADLPFMPVTEYDPLDTDREGWTARNDLEAPASVGVQGAAEISGLKLWRDTVYTAQGLAYRPGESMSRTAPFTHYVDTFFVHPGHYLCLGDNSAQSSDSRDWGTVPERLLMGKAVFTFWPLMRVGFIR